MLLGLLWSQMVKESACDGGDSGLIPGLGRIPDERNDHPLQYSCLDNPMARGVSRVAVHGVPSQTGPSHQVHGDGGAHISSAQSLSRVRLFVTPWAAARQASLSITTSWSLFKHMSIQSAMPSAISSSVVPFSSRPQSFPASGSFPVSQFFTSGGQSVGVSQLQHQSLQ